MRVVLLSGVASRGVASHLILGPRTYGCDSLRVCWMNQPILLPLDVVIKPIALLSSVLAVSAHNL